jgi:hypothetical protein
MILIAVFIVQCLTSDLVANEISIFNSDDDFSNWTRAYFTSGSSNQIIDAFLYYTRANGLFQRQLASKTGAEHVFFFASLLHQNKYADVRFALFRLCSHRTKGTDLMRHALLLALWHVPTNSNEFLVERAIAYWKRPLKALMQLESALDRRQAHRKQGTKKAPKPPADPVGRLDKKLSFNAALEQLEHKSTSAAAVVDDESDERQVREAEKLIALHTTPSDKYVRMCVCQCVE